MKKTIVILGLLIYTSNQNNSKTVICKSFNAGTPAGVKGKAKLFDGYFKKKSCCYNNTQLRKFYG